MEFDYFPVDFEELSAAITFNELGEGEGADDATIATRWQQATQAPQPA